MDPFSLYEVGWAVDHGVALAQALRPSFLNGSSGRKNTVTQGWFSSPFGQNFGCFIIFLVKWI
jgi:hypothetical protein